MVRISERIKIFLLYLVFFLIMVFVISQKQNLHVDEVWSYVLSNNPGEKNLKNWLPNGETVPSAGELFTRYMGADEEHRFDYRVVWENQAEDVHPPLYYTILHTICSFFPGRWSKWMAAVINIFAALGVLYYFRRLIALLCDDPAIRRFLSISFILLTGILHAVTFFRMYILAMLFVTAGTVLVTEKLGGWKDQDPASQHADVSRIRIVIDWGKLCICIFLGALTHYYCTFYMILLCASFGVILICERRYRDIVGLILTSAIAGFCALLVFPAMIGHVLSSNHGVNAQEQLLDSARWLDRLGLFYGFLSGEVFGGLLGALIVAGVFLLILHGVTDPERSQEPARAQMPPFDGHRSLLLCIVCGLYFVAVSIMASLKQDRYLFPMYAVIFAAVLCAAYSGLKQMLSRRGAQGVLVILLAVIITGSAADTMFSFLYRESAPAQSYADQNPDTDCVLIYGGSPWMINADIYEIMRYHALTAYMRKAVDMDQISGLIGDQREVVVIMVYVKDEEDLLKQILEKLSQKREAEKLQTFTYGSSYRIRMASVDE